MLVIKNLQVSIDKKEILRGIDLEVKAGEIHAIMGQNGSGKTTLARVIAGLDREAAIKGEVRFLGRSLLKMEPEDRARMGVFLAFQNPIEIPGLSLFSFLMTALNEVRQSKKESLLDPFDFSKLSRQKAEILGLKKEFLSRGVNEGFSGGEKKKNEVFQMLTLEPKLAILDEIDSGLDIDSLKKVAQAINKAQNKNNSFLIITHYQRILNYIKPDKVHILIDGKIVKSGDYKLAKAIEKKGYEGI